MRICAGKFDSIWLWKQQSRHFSRKMHHYCGVLPHLVVKNAKMFFFSFKQFEQMLFCHLSVGAFDNKSVIYSIEHSRKCVTTQQQMSGRCCIMARSFWAEQLMHKIWMTKYEYCLSTRQASRCAELTSSWCPNGFFNWLYFSNKF